MSRAYHEGAERKGHTVRQINIGALEVPFLRSAAEFAATPTEKLVIEGHGAFLAASHVVFIYPLWLGGPLALLKAYMEQLSRDQFLLRERGRALPIGSLKGRSARVIVTMGMPTLLYRTIFGAHGTKAFNRSILGMAGFAPINTSYFGGTSITSPKCATLIERMRELGSNAA